MQLDLVKQKEEMRNFIGDLVDIYGFNTYLDPQSSFNACPINHMQFCIFQTNLYPEFENYIKHFLTNTNDIDMNELSKLVCRYHHNVTPEIARFIFSESKNFVPSLNKFFGNVCYKDNTVHFIDLLIEYGAEVNSPDKYNRTPLENLLRSTVISSTFCTSEEVFRKTVRHLLVKGVTYKNIDADKIFWYGAHTREVYISCIEAWEARYVKPANKVG